MLEKNPLPASSMIAQYEIHTPITHNTHLIRVQDGPINRLFPFFILLADLRMHRKLRSSGLYKPQAGNRPRIVVKPISGEQVFQVKLDRTALQQAMGR